jgi:ribonuclease Z
MTTNKGADREAEGATRRTVITGGAAAMIGWEAAPDLTGLVIPEAHAAMPALAKDEIAGTLLGTASPQPRPDRFGPATLIEAGGLTLLFDAGRGVTIRLAQLHIPLGKGIDAIFLTHYHSDHVNGLPDIWMTGYLPGPLYARQKPMRLWGPIGKMYGPTGVSRIAKNMLEAYSDDIRIRMADEHVPEAATRIEAHDFEGDGVIFDQEGVKITAFEVNHGPLIKPAFGYRVDYAGRSVTISGDTKLNDNVIKYGSGTDLLIHEVCAMPAALADDPIFKAIAEHHTSPEDAGIVFSRAKPKLAAFTHIVQLAKPGVPPISLDELAARTWTNYQGPLVLGEDLMRFTVGNAVTAHKWDAQRNGYPD